MRSSLRQVLLRSATGLDLNFAGGVFSLNNTRTDTPAAIPGWSFSRTDTNGTATALDLAGNVIQFATGVPRITNRGILVEEARTNLFERSYEFDNAYWSKTNLTVTTGLTAPDGTATAQRLQATTTAATNCVRAVTVNATSATYSIFAKKGSGATDANLFTLRNTTTATILISGTINYDTGVWTYNTGSTGVTVTPLADGWYRIAITATSGITSGNSIQGYVCYLGNTETAGENAIVWGAQLELGAFATSPIITTGAAGTRDGETVSLGTAALPPEGTIILTYVVQPTAVGTAARTYGFNLTDAGNSRFSLRIGDSGLATTPVAIMGDGAALTTLTGSSLTPGTTAKVAVSYSSLSAQFAMAVNGSDQTGARQAVAATLALTFRLGSIGTPGTNAINSPIARAQIIPRFLSAAERIALTAP